MNLDYMAIINEHERTKADNAELMAENARLQAENKNLIAKYEMLSVSYMDSKRTSEHLFTELKRYKSLLCAKLPERELMLIDEIQKLRKLLVGAYEDMDSWQKVIASSDQWGYGKGCLDRLCDLRDAMRELGIEVE